MARIPIEMPKLGYDMETGVVAGWVKHVGDRVLRGDVIAEIVHESGTQVPVGEVIAYLDDGT
jgi:pyruvate/2-oxoglutarate dehydrogenase complex dihydrolipoamide acyltransferase (E2) component